MSWYTEKIEDAKKVVGEKGLSEENIEAIYRLQEMKYRMEDARNHLDEDFDWDDYDLDIEGIYNDDKEIQTLVEIYMDKFASCDSSANDSWDKCIDYFLKGYGFYWWGDSKYVIRYED